MKITIFGATGGVGQNLVHQAISAGHLVKAFTRSPEKLKAARATLQICTGDVLNLEQVKSAVSGSDAVICALGMPLLNNQGLRAAGTKNIVTAMQAIGVSRLICLSGLGAGDSHDLLPALNKFLLKPTVMRRLYADHEAQEAQVTGSNLKWTLVRPGSFVDGSHTGRYQHGFTTAQKGLAFKISREDVADFMLRQLESEIYLRRAANLSY